MDAPFRDEVTGILAIEEGLVAAGLLELGAEDLRRGAMVDGMGFGATVDFRVGLASRGVGRAVGRCCKTAESRVELGLANPTDLGLIVTGADVGSDFFRKIGSSRSSSATLTSAGMIPLDVRSLTAQIDPDNCFLTKGYAIQQGFSDLYMIVCPIFGEASEHLCKIWMLIRRFPSSLYARHISLTQDRQHVVVSPGTLSGIYSTSPSLPSSNSSITPSHFAPLGWGVTKLCVLSDPRIGVCERDCLDRLRVRVADGRGVGARIGSGAWASVLSCLGACRVGAGV
jgi:hypothetical protein